jgi:multidrug resistance efflux pump
MPVSSLTWGDYVSYKARAEAAERRVAELEKTLREIRASVAASITAYATDSLGAAECLREIEEAVSGESPE